VNDAPLSADRLAERLGDALVAAGDVPPEAFALVDEVRALVRAVVETDADAATRAAAAAAIGRVRRDLESSRRPARVLLVRHPDGRIEHLTQAGSGRLNPQAPPLTFVDLPPDPPPGRAPASVEVHGTCTLTAAHGGPPSGAHGGVVALVLDQALGVAARAGGGSGMTVALHVEFRRPTPLDAPLDVTARWTGSNGRKSTATGELRAGGEVTAEATALFVREVV
jgi:acyl-coenzyme A thioesterase PaaI-like protein